MADPLQEALLQRELEQQEPKPEEQLDKQIKAALELLGADERPTVPVRIYTDPEKVWREVLLPLGQRRLTPKAVGFTPDDHSAIYFKQGSDDYNDMYKLASKIIHENVHAKAPNGDRRELPAYEQELAWIDKHPVNFDIQYRKAIADYVEALRKAQATQDSSKK